jgi:hypothetical protein
MDGLSQYALAFEGGCEPRQKLCGRGVAILTK